MIAVNVAIEDVLIRAAEYGNRFARRERLARAERFINRTCYADGFFGVEGFSECGQEVSYLNSGDTYTPTIIQQNNGRLTVSTWGDVLEEIEREYCEEEGAIRCGYCSAFTPCADDWRATRCESCGRNVSSGEVMPEVACDDDETTDDE